jgi:hypothetical protein
MGFTCLSNWSRLLGTPWLPCTRRRALLMSPTDNTTVLWVLPCGQQNPRCHPQYSQRAKEAAAVLAMQEANSRGGHQASEAGAAPLAELTMRDTALAHAPSAQSVRWRAGGPPPPAHARANAAASLSPRAARCETWQYNSGVVVTHRVPITILELPTLPHTPPGAHTTTMPPPSTAPSPTPPPSPPQATCG